VALLAAYIPLDLRLPNGGLAAAWRIGWMAVLIGAAAPLASPE
jgi:hypothetical protein